MMFTSVSGHTTEDISIIGGSNPNLFVVYIYLYISEYIIMKKALVLSLVVGLLSLNGCEKHETGDFETIKVGHFGKLDCPSKSIKGANNSIVGKWKLVEHTILLGNMQQPENGSLRDYSCSNIIYQFNEDGTLTVSSDHIDFPSGQREYQFSPSSLTPYIKNPFFNHNYILKVRYHDLMDWDVIDDSFNKMVSISDRGNRMAIIEPGLFSPGVTGYSSFIRIE